MNIGINATWFHEYRSGLERLTVNLLLALAELDRQNCYHVFAHSKTGPLGIEGRPNFQTSLIPRIPKLRLGVEQLFFPARSLIKPDLDILHTTAFVSPILTRRAAKVMTVCDLVPQLFPQTQVRKVNWYLRALYPAALRQSQALIAISENTKRDLVRLYKADPAKVQVIYPGVSSQFRPLDQTMAQQRVLEKYQIPAPFVLSVGSIEPRKNLARLVTAYTEARQDPAIKHKLVLTGGKGWLNTPLAAQIEQSGLSADIIQTGYIADEDLPYLYAAADALVYPSIYEGWGLPILEAMACGTPVVTSNLSSMPEVAGDAALLVDPYDTGALAEAIRQVVTDQTARQKMIEAGLKRPALFTWENTARQTLAVYQQVKTSSKK